MKVELMSYTPSPEKLIEKTYLMCRHLLDELPLKGKSTTERIDTIWKKQHLGCFEEASATITASGISRTCTHQLVRHRLFSYKQLSMRAVEPASLDSIIPPSIKDNKKALILYLRRFTDCREAYYGLRKLGIPKEDARFIIPMGVETQISITGNFRNWLHFLGMRTSPAAQWEIQELAWKCYELLEKIAPNVFTEKYQMLWKYV